MEKQSGNNPACDPKRIRIALMGENWFDITNDIVIGDCRDLIQYVNDKHLVVVNEDCFIWTSRFWYNQVSEVAELK